MEGIAMGRVLRVKGNEYALVKPEVAYMKRYLTQYVDIELVESYDAKKLIESNLLCKLTRYRNNSKLGWSDLGLDGSNCEFYCCMQ